MRFVKKSHDILHLKTALCPCKIFVHVRFFFFSSIHVKFVALRFAGKHQWGFPWKWFKKFDVTQPGCTVEWQDTSFSDPNIIHYT